MNQSQNKSHNIYNWILIIVGIIILSSISFLFLVNTNQIIAYITQSYQLNTIQIQKLDTFINNDNILKIRVLISFIGVLFLIQYVFFKDKLIVRFIYFISKIGSQITSLCRSLNLKDWFVITIAMIFKMVLLYYLPLHLDELFSYLFLSSKGILVSLSYYPGPNNHIAYNVFTAILLKLNLPTLLTIRLPSLIADFLILLLIIKTFKKFFPTQNFTVFAAIIIFSTSYLPYSISGRGYALQTLSCLVATLSVFYWKNDKTYYSIIFVLANSLGFWVIPTHLYFFTSILMVQLYLNKNFKSILGLSIAVGGITFLLYAPILLLGNIQLITNNGWTKPLEITQFKNKLISFSIQYLNSIIGFQTLSLLIILLILSYLIIKKHTTYLNILLFFIFFPVLFLLIQRVIPFMRVFTYLNLLFAFGTVFYLLQNFNKKYLYLFVIIQCYFFYSFILNTVHYKHQNDMAMNKNQQLVSKIITQQQQHFFVNNELAAYQLSYIAKEKNLDLYFKWKQ